MTKDKNTLSAFLLFHVQPPSSPSPLESGFELQRSLRWMEKKEKIRKRDLGGNGSWFFWMVEEAMYGISGGWWNGGKGG